MIKMWLMIQAMFGICALQFVTTKYFPLYKMVTTHPAVTGMHKVHCGGICALPKYKAARIHNMTKYCECLKQGWLDNITYDASFVYMAKAGTTDNYEPAKPLYYINSTDSVGYWSAIPGSFDVGARIEITMTIQHPWNDFDVVIRGTSSDQHILKMTAMTATDKTKFTNRVANQNLDPETSTLFATFPNTPVVLSFTVTDTAIQVDVDGFPYHTYSYINRQPPTDARYLGIWLLGLPDNIDLHRVSFKVVPPPSP